MNHIIYVEWIDSEAPEVSDWTAVEEIESDDYSHKCYSVGFLVKENEFFVWLSNSIDPANSRCCGWMKIPKVAITKTERFRK